MNAVEVMLSQPIVHRVGWALLHLVWQGAVLAGILWIAMVSLRNRSARTRYVAACLALAGMAVLPAVTILLDWQPEALISSGDPSALMPLPPQPEAAGETPTALPLVLPPVPWYHQVLGAMDANLPWIVAGWGCGVLVLSIRLLVSWSSAQRIRRTGVRTADGAWQATLVNLCRRMRIDRAVRLLESSLIHVPVVIGYLRPVILVPVQAFTGLDRGQLEMILAHELAHVQRHDYLVNLIQMVIETLLFYHPAVWWISRRIRIERENCCDDLAVAACGNRIVYARALVNMEELRHAPASLMVAADGGSLFLRISRLVGGTASSPRPLRSAAGVTVLVTLTALMAALHLSCFRTRPVPETQDGNINAQVARINIGNATQADVLRVFGEPQSYRWGPAVLDKDHLPGVYVMSYPNGFQVFMRWGKVAELRFERPGPFVFMNSLRVGSTLDKVLNVVGAPQETVEGKQIGFIDGTLYKDINGRKGYCYYGRQDRHVRFFFMNYRVMALYVTSDHMPTGGFRWGGTGGDENRPKAKIPATSTIDKKGRIVDKTDYPFVNDPEAVGNWTSVDFVADIGDFKAGKKCWSGDLYLKKLVLLPDGKMPQTSWTWTKGLILDRADRTASRYTLKSIGGSTYMFYEWKSGDYIVRHMKPLYYVLKKVSAPIEQK